MPWMLFGTDSDAANDPDVQGWVDAGKFLTGASAVGTIAIPAILFHAGKIVVGSFLCELAAALVLGTTAVAYLNLGSSDEYMVCLNTPKFGRPQSRSRADTARLLFHRPRRGSDKWRAVGERREPRLVLYVD